MINVTYMFINYLVFVFLKMLLRASTRFCSYISNTYLGLSILKINDLSLLQNNIIFMEHKDYYMYHTTNSAFDFSAQYSHSLSGNDYVGFTLDTNEEFDYLSFQSTYFTELGNDTYLRLSASSWDITDFELDRTLFGADYYFNAKTSVSIAASTDDWHEVGAKYFFNDSVAAFASFENNDGDVWEVGFAGHF